MAVELAALVMDSQSPRELAQFWARALRWNITSTTSRDLESVPTDATSFRLALRDGAQPKVARNPIHFDLTSASLDEQQSSVADLIAHGARLAEVGQVGDEGHVVLADPEGNEFCVIEPATSSSRAVPALAP